MGKVVGLLELQVERKGIISSGPFSLGFLSLLNGICKVLFMLFAIRAIGCFWLQQPFQFRVFFFNNSTDVSSQKKWNIFEATSRVILCKRYISFKSVSLLFICIQIFVPVLFIIISKNGKVVALLFIVNCKLEFTWFKIVSKSLLPILDDFNYVK